MSGVAESKEGDLPVLELHTDEARTHLIASMKGGPEAFVPIIVPGSRVFYNVTHPLMKADTLKMFAHRLDGMWLQVC